jgi:hypothetical protein
MIPADLDKKHPEIRIVKFIIDQVHQATENLAVKVTERRLVTQFSPKALSEY